jgi:hypothetical protein
LGQINPSFLVGEAALSWSHPNFASVFSISRGTKSCMDGLAQPNIKQALSLLTWPILDIQQN